MFNETFINPAYVGSHRNFSANLLYRNQWVGMEGSPKTETFSIHGPIRRKNLGIGFSIMHESIAVTDQLLVAGTISYKIPMKNSTLSFGLQGKFVNDVERLTEIHTISSGDNQFSTDVKKYFLPNAGFGMYYYREKFYAGVSIPRLFQNKIESTQSSVVVRNFGNLKVWHYYLATGYVHTFNENLKMKPTLMFKVVQNAPLQGDFNLHFILRDFVWFGAGYRSEDACALLVGLQLSPQLKIGYSYDYTLSKLQKFNSGSHEFTIGYNFGFKDYKMVNPRYF
jgi:type IX secretion system PorP/SprF family membrane protein